MAGGHTVRIRTRYLLNQSLGGERGRRLTGVLNRSGADAEPAARRIRYDLAPVAVPIGREVPAALFARVELGVRFVGWRFVGEEQLVDGVRAGEDRLGEGEGHAEELAETERAVDLDWCLAGVYFSLKSRGWWNLGSRALGNDLYVQAQRAVDHCWLRLEGSRLRR